MTTNVHTSLLKAQKEFDTIVFDKYNPHFKNNYASLAAIKNAIEPALHKYGFIISQPWECIENGDLKLSTVLIHESGDKIILASSIIKAGKTDQQLGSSVTYQRRYQISSALFLFAEEDDDAETAEGRTNPPQSYKPNPKPEPKKAIPVAPPTNPSDPTINKGQVAELKDRLKDFPELRDKILKFTGKALIADTPAKDFDKVMIYLDKLIKEIVSQEGVA